MINLDEPSTVTWNTFYADCFKNRVDNECRKCGECRLFLSWAQV